VWSLVVIAHKLTEIYLDRLNLKPLFNGTYRQ
jgi:hypothetical protein